VPPDEAILFGLCLCGYLFTGSLATLFPSIMPALIQGFGLKLAVVALIFPANSAGTLIGGVLTGIWSDRVGRKPFFCGSALLSGVGLMGAFSAHHWPLFVASYLLIGVAQGALSNSINALVLDLSALSNRGKALNSLHGLYSLGATVSPFIIRAALGSTMNWRSVLFGAAVIWLALSLAAIGFRYPAPRIRSVQRRAFQAGLLTNSLFAMLFVIAFLYNGVAWSLLGWVKETLQRAGAHPAFASGMISLFYLGLTVGRFACATFSERLGYGKTLLLCAVGTTLAYPIATFGAQAWWIACGVFLNGLFLSGLYPIALACATRLFPNRTGTVTGTMAVAMTLGAALPPYWTGVIGGQWGLSIALRLNYALVLFLTGISIAVLRREARRQVQA